MRRVVQISRQLIAAVVLVALAVVLFPTHTQPLWEWIQNTVGAVGQGPLPEFPGVQQTAGISLLALVIGGIVYTIWRDRRFAVLQAEYSHQTGAKHLKQKVHELENQVKQFSEERDELQQSYDTLNKEHTAALVASKEHEVRSEFGKEDRESLKTLRHQFDELLQKKGHTEGFHEAMELLMANFSNPKDPASVPVQTIGSKPKPPQPNGMRNRALAFDR